VVTLLIVRQDEPTEDRGLCAAARSRCSLRPGDQALGRQCLINGTGSPACFFCCFAVFFCFGVSSAFFLSSLGGLCDMTRLLLSSQPRALRRGTAPRRAAFQMAHLPAALQTGGMPRAFVSTDATYSTLRMFVVAHIGQVVSLGASARACHAALLIAGASLRVKRHQWRDRDTVQQHRRSDHRGDDAEQVLRHGAG